MTNPTGIEAEVCRDIADRQARGVQKYGVTLEDNPARLSEWIQHAYEESIDLPNYLKKAKKKAEELEAKWDELRSLLVRDVQKYEMRMERYQKANQVLLQTNNSCKRNTAQAVINWIDNNVLEKKQ